MVEMLMFIVT